jgi:hypothetical protein
MAEVKSKTKKLKVSHDSTNALEASLGSIDLQNSMGSDDYGFYDEADDDFDDDDLDFEDFSTQNENPIRGMTAVVNEIRFSGVALAHQAATQ